MNRFIFSPSLSSLYACLLKTTTMLLIATQAHAVTLPDYCSTPEYDPFRSYDNSVGTEIIDPFSGSLSLVHQDLVIPGNNGLDLIATRSYRSLQSRQTAPNYDYKPWASPLGAGWDMHFGRLLTGKRLGSTQANCRTPGDARFNPVLELPNGTRKMFYNATGSDYAFISKDRWIMKCETNGAVLVHSPDGLTYKFGYFTLNTYGSGYGGYPAYHVTEIYDLNNNTIVVEYDTATAQAKINRAYFSGQPTSGITFNYDQPKAGRYRLRSITANGQTWEYHYKAAEPAALNFYPD